MYVQQLFKFIKLKGKSLLQIILYFYTSSFRLYIFCYIYSSNLNRREVIFTSAQKWKFENLQGSHSYKLLSISTAVILRPI